MTGTRHLALGASIAVLLALALACGRGPKRAPAQEDGAPSLGDLLGAPEPVAPAADPATASAAPPALPPLETLIAEPPPDPPSQETPECTAARAALRARRTEVDQRRAEQIAAAEQTLARGQLAMQDCLKTHPCNKDAEAMAAAQQQASAAEGAYQAAMQRIAAWEAELFPYEQEVDRACGRL